MMSLLWDFIPSADLSGVVLWRWYFFLTMAHRLSSSPSVLSSPPWPLSHSSISPPRFLPGAPSTTPASPYDWAWVTMLESVMLSTWSTGECRLFLRALNTDKRACYIPKDNNFLITTKLCTRSCISFSQANSYSTMSNSQVGSLITCASILPLTYAYSHSRFTHWHTCKEVVQQMFHCMYMHEESIIFASDSPSRMRWCWKWSHQMIGRDEPR